MLRHVLRLPQQVPWTGQPGRTTGLERLGFYGDTWCFDSLLKGVSLPALLHALLNHWVSTLYVYHNKRWTRKDVF